MSKLSSFKAIIVGSISVYNMKVDVGMQSFHLVLFADVQSINRHWEGEFDFLSIVLCADIQRTCFSQLDKLDTEISIPLKALEMKDLSGKHDLLCHIHVICRNSNQFFQLARRCVVCSALYGMPIGAVHKVRHAIFGQFWPPFHLSHFVTHTGTPKSTSIISDPRF